MKRAVKVCWPVLLVLVIVAVGVAGLFAYPDSIGLMLTGQAVTRHDDGSVTVNGRTFTADEYRRLMRDCTITTWPAHHPSPATCPSDK